jgi:hypothetical protein
MSLRHFPYSSPSISPKSGVKSSCILILNFEVCIRNFTPHLKQNSMVTDTPISLPSHKRTSSKAENITTPPQPKRQAPEPSSFPKHQYVYIAIKEISSHYTDNVSNIHSVYASLRAVNNAVIRIAAGYEEATGCSRGIDEDGRVHWFSEDAGEGATISITIEEQKVRPEGSEPEREWGDDGPRDERVEDGDEEDEEEEE